MTRDDMHPIRDLAMLVEQIAGAKVRECVMGGYERVATASATEVAQWLKGAMDRLDAHLDRNEIADHGADGPQLRRDEQEPYGQGLGQEGQVRDIGGVP